MIQRIQSLFLVGVAVLMVISLFTKTWSKENRVTHEKATQDAFYITHTYINAMNVSAEEKKPVYFIAAAIVGVIGLSMWTLFSYTDRLKQMKICLGNSALMTLILVLNVWVWFQAKGLFDPTVTGDFSYGFLAPTFGLLLNRSAIYFIRRDERLVRDADRIR